MANRSAGSLPALLVLLDGWENFVVASEAHDAGASVELLHGLVREAASAGLTVALSGGRAALTGRVTASITRTYLLGGAPADLALIGVGVGTGSRTGTSGSARTCGSPLPPGRAVAAADGNHVQFAVTDDNWQRTIAGPVRAPLPIRLRPLPQAVRRSQLSGYQVPADHVLLGLGGDGADPVTVDLFADDARWLIAGPPRSGRSTLLVSILAQSGARSSDAGGCNVLIAASRRSPLVGAGEALGVRVIRPDTDGPFPALYGQRQLVLVDDCEAFTDTAVGAELERLARQAGEGTTAVVVAGRPDDLAVTFRGVAAEVRRAHTGILLRPAPGDGDLLGVHLGRSRSSTPPGRGVLVSHQPQLEALAFGEPALPIQIAG
jgi:S-DNA-T family DNA segregation ATPase FtsK/SpoIIIE